jgi:hypothetical protein
MKKCQLCFISISRRSRSCLLELSIVDKFEEWLGPLPNMKEKQYETQKIRKAGTGSWLLNNNKFIQ